MASPLVAPPVARAQALACPNCGGPVERRGFGYSLTVVCPQCLTVLDASTPQLEILQKIEAAQERRTPLIPLGSRGNFGGVPWEAIGYQTRAVFEDGEMFEWEEYLLFNPYHGFRYITQYDGHWNIVTPVEALPQSMDRVGRVPFRYEGHYYRHFSGAPAVTMFVLGEFPWRVRVGDKVMAHDYVDPPSILSAEITDDEITWSRGEYTPGADIWRAFALPGSPPPARGIYLNQPSPYTGKVGGMWGNFGLMLLIVLGLALFFAVFSKRQTVFHNSYNFSSVNRGDASFVSSSFELTGRPAPLEVDIKTNLEYNSAYFNFALINQDNGQAYDFGREVSYYGDEGSPRDSVLVSAVPPGHYYLRVEPEMETGSMNYELTLREDVPSYAWFWLAAGLLLIPPVGYSVRARNFETQRWAQASSGGGSVMSSVAGAIVDSMED